jgi:Kef-type K+ transport system membrane component KefB
VTGFLIDPPVFLASIVGHFPLVAGIVGALLIGKWLAAELAGRSFGYSAIHGLRARSCGRSPCRKLPATLATTLVAFDTFHAAGHRSIDEELLNAILVLMLTTSILGPVLTERFSPHMLEDERPIDRDAVAEDVPRQG